MGFSGWIFRLTLTLASRAFPLFSRASGFEDLRVTREGTSNAVLYIYDTLLLLLS